MGDRRAPVERHLRDGRRRRRVRAGELSARGGGGPAALPGARGGRQHRDRARRRGDRGLQSVGSRRGLRDAEPEPVPRAGCAAAR